MLTKKERAAQLAAQGHSSNSIVEMLGVSKVWIDRMIGSSASDATPDAEFVAYLHAYRGDTLTEEDLEYIDPEDPRWSKTSEGTEVAALQDKYRSLEHKVLNKLHDAVAMALDAKELNTIINTIANRQAAIAKSVPLVQINQQFNTGNTHVQTVQLSLPEHALGKDALQLSSSNEVMAIEGRSLSSLTAHETSAIIEAKRKEKKDTMSTEFPDL